jgi:hypothetical protein
MGCAFIHLGERRAPIRAPGVPAALESDKMNDAFAVERQLTMATPPHPQ